MPTIAALRNAINGSGSASQRVIARFMAKFAENGLAAADPGAGGLALLESATIADVRQALNTPTVAISASRGLTAADSGALIFATSGASATALTLPEEPADGTPMLIWGDAGASPVTVATTGDDVFSYIAGATQSNTGQLVCAGHGFLSLRYRATVGWLVLSAAGFANPA
jgi:hypothetical protein